MILPPTLVIAALNLTGSSSANPKSDISPVLCYDSRYARTIPPLDDCADIAIKKIGIHNGKHVQRFARHPKYHEIGVPKQWASEGGCVVQIDMPRLPGRDKKETVEATMMDVKRAALEVVLACVAGDEHLGGVVSTGTDLALQVSVFGRVANSKK
ncbi:MAG: hypothetical protein Q9219_000916 [cf. Caloplaca sp. 3 TL-2023]